MSHDVVADALNQMMNARKAGLDQVVIRRHSQLLISVLAIAKLKKYITSYELKDNKITIIFDKLNGCNAIKPRFVVKSDEIEKYVPRYLPAKDLGIIIVSTPSGIMTHHTAIDKRQGGCLLAYFF
ncbi:30S ribosomal protein S8 [Candidatus Pacearchaeota archaeon]|nr:30S ribosomal protein S8 [Candidatus Pacearchaeota archaeon]